MVNAWGPQTVPAKLRSLSARSADVAGRDEAMHQLPEGIEERLTNMETHLNIRAGSFSWQLYNLTRVGNRFHVSSMPSLHLAPLKLISL